MHALKKALPVLALLLIGCSGTAQTFELTFDVTDAQKKTDLVFASQRVLERRLQSFGESGKNVEVNQETEPVTATVRAKDLALLEAFTKELTAPFKLRVMKEAKAGAKDTIAVEGHGSFGETGITENDIEWMQATADSVPTKGRVTISFTEEGRAKMKKVFAENHRKFIGIFVRDQLVSKLLVDTDALIDDIVISEIPSLELAQIFADDMNVGAHVTFTPVSAQ